jgi:uncharacterized protein YaeQ
MALTATRYEFRITLHHVDLGLEHAGPLVVALHPSETIAHMVLRVLTWCLLFRERLSFGPGLSTPDAPDLLAADLTGRITTWIACGTPSADALKRAVQHHSDAEIHAVFVDPRRRAAVESELEGWKRAEQVRRWTIDRALVDGLAANEARRQTWTVTAVGDHLYVEADNGSVDGPVAR